MATKIIKTTFQVRRGLASTWRRLNVVLAAGEPGFERDTHKLKVGDGSTPWNELPYIGESQGTSLGDNIVADVNNGVIYTTDGDGNTVIIADSAENIDIESIEGLFE